MDEPIERVRETFQGAVPIENEPLSDSSHRREGRTPPISSNNPIDTGLPDDFPVQPLGQGGGKFHFLTARDEMVELSAGAMTNRANLVAMFSGCDDPVKTLASIAKPTKRDNGFSTATAADKLMQACSALPLFDPSTPVRHFGTWRGGTDVPVVHLGETIEADDAEARRGRMIARALYPAVPSRAFPAGEAASIEDLRWIRDRIEKYWNWQTRGAANLLMGWIGQAALGQYPSWRTHCYLKGKHGSGKTTATRIVSDLLGGMSAGVRNSTSAAAIRQTTNRQAIARVFDEAEAEERGSITDVIALFRLMSDAEGAQVERGTSDHSGVKFELYGAGFLSSIIPAAMTSADRSRFVILTMRERAGDTEPSDDALWLAELQEDAREIGPSVWRRMLDLAPKRWDKAFRVYNSLIQGLGARARTADTIGAILAGWDLMLFDTPMSNNLEDPEILARLEEAKLLAQPLIDFAAEGEEEGEGDRCLRTIFGANLHKDHGGIVTVAELIDRMQNSSDSDNKYDNRLIGRLGLRLLDGPQGEKELFVANGANPQLDQALRGTRWRSGGHKAALETIDDVRIAEKAHRVAGRVVRGVIVPARLLPGYDPDPDKDEVISIDET